jgi:GT2 family glycosyltransferase
MTKIAILMPTYNGATHIEQAIDSILAAKPFEHKITALYISDDNSKDDTVHRIQAKWDSATPLVVNVSTTNQGLYGNHNVGLHHLMQDGIEWVLILHQDDYVKPNWLEVLCRTIQNVPATTASICTSYDSFWNDNSVAAGEDKPDSPPTEVFASSESIRSTLLTGCWWHISGVAIRLSTFAKIGFFDATLPHLADWDWTLRCFAHGYNILYIPRTLMGWRQHPDSYSAHSMRTVGYAQQLLQVLERYKYVLSRKEHLQWHTQQGYYALRRTIRAIQLRNPTFFREGVKTIMLFAVNGMRQ